MSTGCLTPLAPMVIPGSQSPNFAINICIVLTYCWAREWVQLKIVVVVVDVCVCVYALLVRKIITQTVFRVNVTVNLFCSHNSLWQRKRGIFKNEPSEDQHSLFNAKLINMVFKNSRLIRWFGQLMKNTVVISLRASSPIWASEASLARTRLGRSLGRFRATRFTRPNRRACSQAR